MADISRKKRTKIVATIGPSSNNEDTLRAMIRAGMNVARINFSHIAPSHYPQQAELIAMIRRVGLEEGEIVSILADLQGPKIRLGDFDAVRILAGDKLTLTLREDFDLKKMEFPLPNPQFVQDIRPNQRLLLDDGDIEMKVLSRNSTDLMCEVVYNGGGELKRRKGVSAPDSKLSLPALTEKDRQDLEFALTQNIDWVAMSFVRRADEIEELRWLIKHNGGDAGIIAKIEKREAIENIKEIIKASDGIMVARGDLGVETDAASVPIFQKRFVRYCNEVAKPVITATQMLNSMIESPRPTRAEASDVANAIFDGTDAVMLSGESASGQYPVEAVETMAEIAVLAERTLSENSTFTLRESSIDTGDVVVDAVCHATVTMAHELKAKIIVTTTWQGSTARRVASERPTTPIVAVTPDERVQSRLALVWGVTPLLVPRFNTIDEMLDVVAERARQEQMVEVGDRMVIIAGVPFGASGYTNFIKLHTVEEVYG